ncbi:hypothetical protein BD626DRAFT_12950 [Schizophyllum amplum]|uniref:RanBD1 domain-containing protein n=1 Tax=Schizophyllum amplum TaxID=97359 RepID=A0A550CXF9_9AGAR|nr:hypothetical protein BD626DRAFT_12950 [Auriculariopsis ampla]
MKRGAERQATRDDADNEDDADPGRGLKKANDAALAARQIRGLPKRSRSSTPVTGDAASSAPPKFSGFGGFGSSSASGSGGFSLGSPPVASSASNATKTFAGLLGASASPAKPATPPAAAPAPSASTKPAAALTYYTALRGLNVSFVSAVSRAVEEDPFADVAALAEHYKTLRISVQRQYDDRAGKENASAPSKAEPPKATMPAPPASFEGFKGFTPSPSLSSAPPSGPAFSFKPTETSSTKPSPFSFPDAKPPVTASAPLPFSLATAPPSSFGAKPSDAPKASGGFSFGKNAESSKLDSSKASAPSGFSFGKVDATKDSKDAAPPSFSFAKSDGTKDEGSGFSFGSSAKNPFSGFGSAPDRAASTNSLFGASPTPTPPPATPPSKPSAFGAFGFGRPPSAGSLGNPVGFGFGSPPRTPGEVEAEGKKEGFSFSSGSAFGTGASFGSAPPFGSKPDDKKEEVEEKTDEGVKTGEEANNLGLLSANPHDEEGIGEEDEETTHVMRAFAFKLDDGKWAKLGTGLVRLKKHKETNVCRMLMRNSSTGKININFKLYGGLTPKVNNKLAVSFVGHDDGHSKTYNLKFKSEDEAQEMMAALNREIEFVKAKEES